MVEFRAIGCRDVYEELLEAGIHVVSVEIDCVASYFGFGERGLDCFDGAGYAGWVRGCDRDKHAFGCCELGHGGADSRGTTDDQDGLTSNGRHVS